MRIEVEIDDMELSAARFLNLHHTTVIRKKLRQIGFTVTRGEYQVYKDDYGRRSIAIFHPDRTSMLFRKILWGYKPPWQKRREILNRKYSKILGY